MSDTYTHILVALDLTEECPQVLNKAMTISKSFNSKISVIHVLEPLSFAYGGDIPMDLTSLQEQIADQAQKQLAKLCEPHTISSAQQHIILGHTQTEVHRVAEEQQVDLVVTGSHGRHGFALILGSTANAILHGAKCDVLAVRITD
jgi:universal stress protein A